MAVRKKSLSLSLPYLGINNKEIAIFVCQNITGNHIPDLILSVAETPVCASLRESKSRHIRVNHHLCGGTGIFNKSLSEYRHYRPSLKTCETVKRVGCVVKDRIMPKGSFQEVNNGTAVHEIVNLVDKIVFGICVILIATWAWRTEFKNIGERNPQMGLFCVLFCNTRLNLQVIHMVFAISKFCFM